jgi:Zn finger protein HypA/HybF involved in hydrogenase expression
MNEPTGRGKNFIKCWDCGGYVAKKLLTKEHYDNDCPLCGATGLVINE